MRPLGPRTKYFPPEEMKEEISKVEKEEEDAHATAFADAVGHLTAAAKLFQSWNLLDTSQPLQTCFKVGICQIASKLEFEKPRVFTKTPVMSRRNPSRDVRSSIRKKLFSQIKNLFPKTYRGRPA